MRRFRVILFILLNVYLIESSNITESFDDDKLLIKFKSDVSENESAKENNKKESDDEVYYEEYEYLDEGNANNSIVRKSQKSDEENKQELNSDNEVFPNEVFLSLRNITNGSFRGFTHKNDVTDLEASATDNANTTTNDTVEPAQSSAVNLRALRDAGHPPNDVVHEEFPPYHPRKPNTIDNADFSDCARQGEWKPMGVIDEHLHEHAAVGGIGGVGGVSSLNGLGSVDLHHSHEDILESVGSYPVANKIIPHWHDSSSSHSNIVSLPLNHKPFPPGFGSGAHGGSGFQQGHKGQGGDLHVASGNNLALHHGNSLTNAEYQKMKSSSMLSPPPLPPVILGKKPGYRKIPKHKHKLHHEKKKRPSGGYASGYSGFINHNFNIHGGGSNGLSGHQISGGSGHFGKGSFAHSGFFKQGSGGFSGKPLGLSGYLKQKGTHSGGLKSGGNGKFKIKGSSLSVPLNYGGANSLYSGHSSYGLGSSGHLNLGSGNGISPGHFSYEGGNGGSFGLSSYGSGASGLFSHYNFGDGTGGSLGHLNVNSGGGSPGHVSFEDESAGSLVHLNVNSNNAASLGLLDLGHENDATSGNLQQSAVDGKLLESLKLAVENEDSTQSSDVGNTESGYSSHTGGSGNLYQHITLGDGNGESVTQFGFNGGAGAPSVHLSLNSEADNPSEYFHLSNEGSRGQESGSDAIVGHLSHDSGSAESSDQINLSGVNGNSFGFLNVQSQNSDSSGQLGHNSNDGTSGHFSYEEGNKVLLENLKLGNNHGLSSGLQTNGGFENYIIPSLSQYGGDSAVSSVYIQGNGGKDLKSIVNFHEGLKEGDLSQPQLGTHVNDGSYHDLHNVNGNAGANQIHVNNNGDNNGDHSVPISVNYGSSVLNQETDTSSGSSNSHPVHAVFEGAANHGQIITANIEAQENKPDLINGQTLTVPYQGDLIFGSPALLNNHLGDGVSAGLSEGSLSSLPNVLTLSATNFPHTPQNGNQNLLLGSTPASFTHDRPKEVEHEAGIIVGTGFSDGSLVKAQLNHGTRGGGKVISDSAALSSQLYQTSSNSLPDPTHHSAQEYPGFVFNAYGVLDDSSTFTCGKNHYHNTKYHTATFQVADNDHPSSVDVIKYHGDAAVLVRSQNAPFHDDIYPERKNFNGVDGDSSGSNNVNILHDSEKLNTDAGENSRKEKSGRNAYFQDATKGSENPIETATVDQYNRYNTKPLTFTQETYQEPEAQQSQIIKTEVEQSNVKFPVNENAFEIHTPLQVPLEFKTKPQTKNLLHPQFNQKPLKNYIQTKSPSDHGISSNQFYEGERLRLNGELHPPQVHLKQSPVKNGRHPRPHENFNSRPSNEYVFRKYRNYKYPQRAIKPIPLKRPESNGPKMIRVVRT